MNDSAIVHEQGFVEFVVPTRRERVGTLLSSQKGREKLIASLSCFSGFADQYVVPVEARSQNADEICALLQSKGAPHTCYVMAENAKLDRKILDLPDVLEAVVGFGLGAFVSCVAGKLAFYEGESPGTRFILEKKRVQERMARG